MQDVSNNLLAGVCCRLVPGKLEAAGAEGRKLEPCRGLWKLRALTDGEASAGLVGASAVLRDALVDGLILRGDVGDGKCPAGGDREQGTDEQIAASGFPPPPSSSRSLSYVFPFVSFTFPPGVSSFPFFSQIR